MPVATLTKGRIYEGREEWAKALKDLRARRGITQREAAEMVGIPIRTWINWENLVAVPTQITQRAIQTVFPDF